jgi:predicted metal-binding membrane protein
MIPPNPRSGYYASAVLCTSGLFQFHSLKQAWQLDYFMIPPNPRSGCNSSAVLRTSALFQFHSLKQAWLRIEKTPVAIATEAII